MSDKIYNILKWIAIIALPAFQVAIPELFTIWHIPYGDQIGETCKVLAVLLGALLMVSSVTYSQSTDLDSDGKEEA